MSMSSDRHEGRTVVITGASSGIGRRIAFRFAEDGAAVVCASPSNEPHTGTYHDQDLDQPTEEIVRSEYKQPATFVPTDVSDPESVRDLISETVDEFGCLDVLVNNAGIYIDKDSQSMTIEEWNELLAVDLSGTYFCSKYAIPHLIESEGDIINIASVNASEGGLGPAYAAAKAGQVNLTRDLAVELGRDNVTVNSISPGYIKTPIQDYLDKEDIEHTRELLPLPRLGEPEDVANMAAFLTSDEASWVTGANVYVDGGWAARRA
jgi:NAD(P)-dependent dehydrogenase (short-subunit alcohol dehydrogenase family)